MICGKFGSGRERSHTHRNTAADSLAYRPRDRVPARQFANEAASVSHSRFLSLPIPVVIHQDRSSIPLFSVQTEIMNQQYEEIEIK